MHYIRRIDPHILFCRKVQTLFIILGGLLLLLMACFRKTPAKASYTWDNTQVTGLFEKCEADLDWIPKNYTAFPLDVTWIPKNSYTVFPLGVTTMKHIYVFSINPRPETIWVEHSFDGTNWQRIAYEWNGRGYYPRKEKGSGNIGVTH